VLSGPVLEGLFVQVVLVRVAESLHVLARKVARNDEPLIYFR
jgi:hypothetical protein